MLNTWPPCLRNHSRLIVVILLCMAITLLSCDNKPVPLNVLKKDAVIVAFGDSITFGSGAIAAESYPAQLERLIQRTVINEGIPGELSRDGLARLASVLQTHQPDLVILCHGGNDILRKTNHQIIAQNLTAMIKTSRQYGSQVVIIGVPTPSLFSLKSAAFYTDIAKQFALPIEANILPTIESNPEVKSDAIHPNARGYQQLAEALARLLHQSGAL